MFNESVETYNVYIQETRFEGVYDVTIPELLEEVFEIRGSYFVLPIIENCVESILGTNKFNLQYFCKDHVQRKLVEDFGGIMVD